MSIYSLFCNKSKSFGLLILLFGFVNAMSQENYWTQFRGTLLNGISEEKNLPVEWDDSTNVIWETRIEGKGWSSPVVYGDQIWVTTATTDGKKMFAVCVDFKTGNLLYNILLFSQDTIYKKHSVNTYATPTPCIEKGRVYLNFGSSGTACVSTENGLVLWKRDDLKCEHLQGPGSSPFLYKDLLILHFEGTLEQYIVALNKFDGKTIWRTDRPAVYYDPLGPVGKKAYSTPIVINLGGRDILISNGAAVSMAYDVTTGLEIWLIPQGEDSTIAMPITENGIVYFYTSCVTPAVGERYIELLAVDPSGSGDVSKSHVLWRIKSPIAQLLTPLIKSGVIYTIDTRNNLFGIDAKTGNLLFTKKLNSKYNSSPVYADGKVYFTSVKGETLVLKAGRALEILAQNSLSGEVYATPAIAKSSMIIRTATSLYRLGTK